MQGVWVIAANRISAKTLRAVHDSTSDEAISEHKIDSFDIENNISIMIEGGSVRNRLID